ncbi:MAG: hypothetical protein QHH27_04495 [Clostridia bacterium]|nr:hypothetical protein [Clostridia bacterium]MDH7572795.1 hypothetical protein [Clostridia bacterium]
MWFERRFLSGLITGGMLGLIAGAVFWPRGAAKGGGREAAVRRITGWLKK